MKKSKPSKKKTVRFISNKKPIQAFEAELKKVYLTKLGIQVVVKKIASNGVQVIPEFSSKVLVVKRSSFLFPCPLKKVRKKTLTHFKFCLEQSDKKPATHNVSRTKGLADLKEVLTSPSVVEEAPSPKQVRRGPKGPRNGSVSSVVDPLLLAGTHTRQQISMILGESEIGKTLTNRDMGWYTGYRIAVLKEKGYSFEQSEVGTIRLFKTNLTKISDRIGSFTGTLFSREKITP